MNLDSAEDAMALTSEYQTGEGPIASSIDRSLYPAPRGGAVSIVGPGITIRGNVKGAGAIHIAGSVEGNIDCSEITIGEFGSVQGDIQADTVLIRGNCAGSIEARVLNIAKTAKVDGKVVVHESLTVEPPARFEGRCRRGRAETGRKPMPEMARAAAS